jgi:HlyD family secretion protein
MKKFIILSAVLAAAAVIWASVEHHRRNSILNDPAFAHGNGRLEATEVYITTKLSERVSAIHVKEGDLVKKGQLLAEMQTDVLRASLDQAKARLAQARAAESGAKAAAMLRKSEIEAAKAVELQKQSSLDGAEKRFNRVGTLFKDSAASKQQYENDETAFLKSRAELAAARANVRSSEASLAAAEADSLGAAANIKAAEADIARIEADIRDSRLTAPVAGRIHHRLAEPGEVLGAGGKLLLLVDLSDMHMTFFLPERSAGKVRIGSEARVLLDAFPGKPLPARISFVASIAQFTPKTVETQQEREKLMFRVKAQLDPGLLKKYIPYVKTGVPGTAWIRIDQSVPWPSFLQFRSIR